MGQEYTAKSFKSGNSVAIRIPAALGVKPDQEWTITEEENGDLHIRAKARPTGKLDVDAFWGKAKHLTHIPVPREDFEPRPSSLKSES